MSLSPEQLAQRRTGITATDVAAIVGLHPYRSPIDVFLDKTDRATPFAGNDRTKWGNLLEVPIREDYAERHGVRVEVPGTLEHPTVTWAKATPDGICYLPRQARPRNGLEIKTHSFRVADQYGDPGTDEVPPHELIQCAWNMYVSGLDDWDLVAFIDGQPAEYRIKRDDDLIDMLRESGERFLVDHVRKDAPPDPDGSKSYGNYLSTAYPQRKKDLVSLDDKPEAMMLVRALRRELDVLAEAKTSSEIIKQNLKAVIGDHAGLEWTDPERKGGKDQIYYRIAKDGSKTDWEAAWRSLVTEAQLVLSVDHGYPDDVVEAHREALTNIADEQRSIALHTDTVSGSRRFNTPRWWNKNPSKED
jgi:putative phage-type endonuclease